MAASAWRTKFSTFKERHLYAHAKSLLCDVHFSVIDANGDKVTIPAHKYVLAISSPAFEDMFYGESAETGPTIYLPDCSKEGLQEMLRYVYSDEVNLTGSNVLDVLYLAEKYMLPFLKEKCEECLEKELKPEDVFHVLPKTHNKKVEEKCWEMIDGATERTVSSEAFLNISKEMLCKVLARDTLAIHEIELFQAVEKWASHKMKEQGLEENKKNKRAFLGEEVIKLIRFPLMSQAQFAEKVLPSRILKYDEVTEVIQTFQKLAPPTVFTNKHRGSKHFRPNTRFKSISTSWTYEIIRSDAVGFKVNIPLYLAGVRLFGNKDGAYTVTMTLYKNDAKITQICSAVRFASEEMDEYYGFDVQLDEPVAIDPDDVYTIEAKISGPNSYYGEHGESTVVCDDIVITFLDSKKSINSTTAKQGQFHSLIFNRR